MTEVPVWKCDFAPLSEGAALNALTVGAKFAMDCKGDIPVEWSQGQLRFEFPKTEAKKEQKQAPPDFSYTLVPLSSENLSSIEARFVVTGYKPGRHEPEYLRVLQGTKGFEVVKPKWEIQSVIKEESGQPPPQPFGPIGPFSLSLPFWVLASVVLALAIIIYAVVRQVRRSAQRRRMLEDLKRHRTALSPLHQFYRDSRGLRRRLHNVKAAEELKNITDEMEKDFRLYVLRQFEIPTLDWSDGDILKDLRHRHRRVFVRAGDPLKKTLRELVRLRKQPQILLQDVEQLQRMSMDTAERMEAARTAGGKA